MKLFGILAALLLVVGVAVALGSDDSPSGSPVRLGDVRLISVEDCDELLDWYRSVAEGIPAGALGGYGPVLFMEGDTAGGAVARDSASTATAAAPQAESSGYSGTNVQEEGVDEPDIVKTNGSILVRAGYSEIEIVDVSGDAPELVSSVPVEEGGTEILLSGDRVLALTNVWRQTGDPDQPVASDDAARIMIAPAPGKQVTVLTAIDISDPAHPDVVETREIPGSYRSARAVGDAARVVIVNQPQLPPPSPDVYEGSDQTEIDRRLEAWKAQAIASMTLEDWAPATGGDCASVTRTSQPEGLSTTSVITLDLDGSLDELDEDSVVADAGTIYASTDRLVIATSRWSQSFQPDGRASTELHAFDISDGASTSYIGSGAVDGYLLNQFALSADDGYVRVATTEDAPWDEAAEVQQTDNGLTVLQEQGSSLVTVGSVDGLGPTERIQAVRYIGDVAYVVTFRQTDPLYAIDLSDPTAPRVAGELKINGYSAYLHPIDGSTPMLLGVGQDATDDGQQLGTQVATFDVGDLGSTRRVDAARVDGGYSSVEYDHKAFLWWADARTVVVPVEQYDPTADREGPWMGAVAFTIGDDGSVVEAGRVTHADRGPQADGWYPVLRSVVVGDALYTVSDAGVLRSDLSSFADAGFAQFPAPDLGEGGGVEPMPVEDDGGIGTSGSAGASTAGSAGEG